MTTAAVIVSLACLVIGLIAGFIFGLGVDVDDELEQIVGEDWK